MNWNEKVAVARAALKKPSPKTSAAQLREIIDDVVTGHTRAAIVGKHGADPVKTALARVTTAVQGKGQVHPLTKGGWYRYEGNDQPYAVAVDFAMAWQEARGRS